MNIPVCFHGVSGQKYKLVCQKVEADSLSNVVGITLVYRVPLFHNNTFTIFDAKALCKKLSSNMPQTLKGEWMFGKWEDSYCKTYSVFCSFVAGAEIRYFETQV